MTSSNLSLIVRQMLHTLQRELAHQNEHIDKIRVAESRFADIVRSLEPLLEDDHVATLLRAEGFAALPSCLTERLTGTNRSHRSATNRPHRESKLRNRHLNNLGTVQEYYRIQAALREGVREQQIAEALHVEMRNCRQRIKLLKGICPEAVSLLRLRMFPPKTIRLVSHMKPRRQVEAVRLMCATNNFTASFVRAIHLASRRSMLINPDRRNTIRAEVPAAIIRKVRQELTALQRDLDSVAGQELIGIDLTVAEGYLRRLLEDQQVVGYLKRHRPELLRNLLTAVNFEPVGKLKN